MWPASGRKQLDGWNRKTSLRNFPHVHTHAPHLQAASGLDEEEAGWKFVHGDVFRFPPNVNLFCAFIGTGTQVCVHVYTTVCVHT
jgi:hypothetical protein